MLILNDFKYESTVVQDKIIYLKQALLLAYNLDPTDRSHHHFIQKLKKIEFLNNTFHIVFENEDYCSEAMRFFNKLIQKNVIITLYISFSTKPSNLFKSQKV